MIKANTPHVSSTTVRGICDQKEKADKGIRTLSAYSYIVSSKEILCNLLYKSMKQPDYKALFMKHAPLPTVLKEMGLMGIVSAAKSIGVVPCQLYYHVYQGTVPAPKVKLKNRKYYTPEQIEVLRIFFATQIKKRNRKAK